MHPYLEISPEVQKALDNNQAIVALESTLVAHGMPYPKNIETAQKLENIVRENGAIPATIAIINGRLKVGLNKDELQLLGTSKEVLKVSRRDIPMVIAKKLNGSTTVASTMIIASIAGIKVFATGGIGGVHRGAQKSFDVSADLMELANTRVAVVCAGCKSVLDIGLTLEYLETHGVAIVGYKTKNFPAFFTRKSGFKVDFSMESIQELATTFQAKLDLKLKGGMIIANPIPKEFEMPYEIIQEAIDDAIEESEERGLIGKEVTPFLLKRIDELTEGTSLYSNQKLVYNNALVAAQLAVELKSLK
ncbi:MAG: pseudouridine-5-phosphate glycosidase [Candidatus Cloacimonadota bacterium]|nr:MAG: pseudouridine-5-phosphate glycosidase [Candidatus Cloacimonadota bacterium]